MSATLRKTLASWESSTHGLADDIQRYLCRYSIDRISKKDIDQILDGCDPKKWLSVKSVCSEAFYYLSARLPVDYASSELVACAFVIACKKLLYCQGYGDEEFDFVHLLSILSGMAAAGGSALCIDVIKWEFSQ